MSYCKQPVRRGRTDLPPIQQNPAENPPLIQQNPVDPVVGASGNLPLIQNPADAVDGPTTGNLPPIQQNPTEPVVGAIANPPLIQQNTVDPVVGATSNLPPIQNPAVDGPTNDNLPPIQLDDAVADKKEEKKGRRGIKMGDPKCIRHQITVKPCFLPSSKEEGCPYHRYFPPTYDKDTMVAIIKTIDAGFMTTHFIPHLRTMSLEEGLEAALMFGAVVKNIYSWTPSGEVELGIGTSVLKQNIGLGVKLDGCIKMLTSIKDDFAGDN